MTKNPSSLYTDEPVIGMDHPLFMAKTQARIDALMSARSNGISLEEALRMIPPRIHSLFGDVPDALITAEITNAYADMAAEKKA
jgi:hypothetical protein